MLVAAATASGIGGRLGVPTRERRLLVACGAAAGLACAYNTPLGAALFSMEILLGSFSLEAFAPLAISSATATLLTWATFGRDPVFHVPAATLSTPWEIALYAALGVLGGVVAALFLFALRAAAALYERARLPRPLAMASAGVVLGIVTLRYPEIVGNGREAVAALFMRPWGVEHVLALLALRLVVTPLAVGSGTVGGVFTPTLFLGAMLGHAFGAGVRALAPTLGADPAAFALAGMGFLLAGTTHAPLTAVVMVFEMTLDYGIVVPLLLGSAVASLVATAPQRQLGLHRGAAAQGGGRRSDGRARRAARRRPRARGPGHGRPGARAAAAARRLRGLAPQPSLRGRRAGRLPGRREPPRRERGAAHRRRRRHAGREGRDARSASRSRLPRRACRACSSASRPRSASGCRCCATSSRAS